MENRLNDSQNVLAVQYACRFSADSFDRNVVQSVFISNGLDCAYLPKIQKKTDAKRAIHDYYKANRNKGSIISSVEESKDSITMQINMAEYHKIMLRDASTGDHVTATTKQYDSLDTVTVIYDICTDSFINDDPNVIETLMKCLDLRRSTYPKNTIKDSLIQILVDKVNAIKVAEGMDLLMVPNHGINLLNSVEKTVHDLDQYATITHYEIAKSVVNQQQISNSVVEKMESFNNGIKARIEKFVEESTKMTPNQQKSMIKEFESQYKFLESYKTILEDQYQKAVENLNATKDLVNGYYVDGKIIDPYQKKINTVIEALGDNKDTIVDVIKRLQDEDENYKSCELPDEISELLNQA